MTLADERKKDFYVIVCHEGQLKHHERALVSGHRDRTWQAGLPHLNDEQRQRISERIGTITWRQISEEFGIELDTAS